MDLIVSGSYSSNQLVPEINLERKYGVYTFHLVYPVHPAWDYRAIFKYGFEIEITSEVLNFDMPQAKWGRFNNDGSQYYMEYVTHIPYKKDVLNKYKNEGNETIPANVIIKIPIVSGVDANDNVSFTLDAHNIIVYNTEYRAQTNGADWVYIFPIEFPVDQMNDVSGSGSLTINTMYYPA